MFSKIKEKVKQKYEYERSIGNKAETKERKREKAKQMSEQIATEVKHNLEKLYKKYNAGGRWKSLKMEELLYKEEPQIQKRKRVT